MSRCSTLAIATTASGLAVFVGGAMAQGKKSIRSNSLGPSRSSRRTICCRTGAEHRYSAPTQEAFLSWPPTATFRYPSVNSDLPKFASDNRDKGTADENKAVVVGSLFYFGTYSVSADGTLATHIEGSSFPNSMGTDQKRTITALSATGVTWINPVASAGGTAELAWKRIK